MRSDDRGDRGDGADRQARVRARLLDELNRLRRNLDDADATAVSILMDRCVTGGPPPLDSLQDQRMLAGLRDRDARRVREVVEALRRVEEGRWGVCEACGGEIEESRLDVLPTAAVCAGCAREGG